MTIRGWARRVVLGLPDGGPARQFDASPRPIDQMFADLRGRGSSISREEALQVPGVKKGRDLLCSVSTLPLVERGPGNTLIDNPLLRQIDPNVANVVTLAFTLEDLLFDAVAWWRVTARRFDGYPASAVRVEPWRVSLEPPPAGAAAYPLPTGLDPAAKVAYVDGKPVAAADLIRFDSPNRALTAVAGRTFRLMRKYMDAAGMYAENPQPSEHFTPADGAEEHPDDEIVEHVSNWRSARRRNATAYIPKWLKYVPGTSASAADMKLPELKQQATLETALVLGIDPEVLGVSVTSRTYANRTDWARDRINDLFAGYMLAITQRLSMGDVTRRGYAITFDLDDYLRADPMTRVQYYQALQTMGAIDVLYIQQEEGLPVVGALTPPTTGQPAATPAPVAEGGDELARRRARAGFDGPPARTFEFAGARGTFNVDAATRTISGAAVPWGGIAAKYGFRFRFERGSIEWHADVGRVKMLQDHDFTRPVGRATAIADGDGSLDVAFKIGSGPTRDAALADASDGIVDGLSVGVDFAMPGDPNFDAENPDVIDDPDNPGVMLVRRATLREVSLTALPAFDDARVTTVQASHTTGGTMPPIATPAPGAPATPAPVAPVAAPVTLQLDAVQRDALLALLGGAAPAAPAAPAGPTVIDPAGVQASTAPAAVAEPEPYRFDRRGNLQRGSHDFSTDLIAGFAGDAAALARATAFVNKTFDVVSTDVNELNPTRNRTDMFVDQLQFEYPVWDVINKGTLTDITPFTFPKWLSNSGLVGAHTEGTEPSSGTYVSTSQTVTPTALSGKAKISRETWDQGGNPQVSNLIWQKMLQGWYEALEARAIAVLDAATPTAIALTAGGGTTGQTASAELVSAIASLQYIRGGSRMRDAFAQIDLFRVLAGARDGNGRPLFPVLGPQNANGESSELFGSINVGGVVFRPSWALAATGSVVASSYLFNRGDVHGWASSPQRLTLDQHEVANVYIGLFGYAATAISDLSGVREITYDPVP